MMAMPLRRVAGAGLIALGVFVTALSLRTSNAMVAFREGVPFLTDPDDVYHAKRILYSVAHFPAVLNFDSQRNLGGAYCPWPPLWDLSAAAMLKLLGFNGVSSLKAATWMEPVFASLFAAALCFVVVLRWGSLAGASAGVMIATARPLIFISSLARLDHHFLEGPLALVILGATAVLICRPRSLAGLFSLSAGIILALFVQTALMIAAGLSVLLLLWFASREALLKASLAFASAAAVVAVYRYRLPSDYPDSAWFLGYPHALLLVAASVALAVAGLPLFAKHSRLLRILSGGAAGAMVAVSFPAVRDSLTAGAGFLGGNEWLSGIQEFQPFFTDRGRVWLDALLLVPMLPTLALARSAIREKSPLDAAIAVFALLYSLLSVSSRRFAYVSIPLLAFSGAVAIHRKLQHGARVEARIFAALMVLPMLLPTLVYRPSSRPEPRVESLIHASFALRILPAPGGVLAPWDAGHLLNYYSGRSVAIDNFGDVGRPGVFKESLGMLLSEDDDRFAAWCRKKGIAYVVLEHPIEQLGAYARILGIDSRRYVLGGHRPRVMPNGERTFWWRAYFSGTRAAIAGVASPLPVKHFRLVWTDLNDVNFDFGMRGNAAQIWEVR